MRKLWILALASLFLVVFLGTNSGRTFETLTANPNAAEQYWLVHADDYPVPTPLLAQAPKEPVTAQTVTYATVEGEPVTGYLARPAEVQEPLPALIVIHEWWGLNENIQTMTRRLAGEGYTVLAVDLYEGEVAQTPERAKELVTAATNNLPRLRDNLRQAYEYLASEQKAPKIASLGWCFGGTWSLNTALLFPEQLDAAVIYYGGGIGEVSTEELKTLQMPILGIFGELDSNPSVEIVRRFEETLKSLNKSVEVYIYENADHAFANPSGTRYNPDAAADAWERTTVFLAEYLKQVSKRFN